ncbi:MAG: DNA methyltransferase [Planctomycetota bacterium]
MSSAEVRFHEEWLGMVQPIDGLVVSIPVLVDTECVSRQPPSLQREFLELCSGDGGEDEPIRIRDFGLFLERILKITDDWYDLGDEVPEELALYVPEGKQKVRPTMALRRSDPQKAVAGDPLPEAEETSATRRGRDYLALVWDLPPGLALDKPETETGPWEYPPAAKFDRLLRHCRVPIGLLTNREVIRLIYAPHGESTGSITFRVEDMATVGGRPILDALVMLFSVSRLYAVAPDRQLPAILAASRRRQADVTDALSGQVFEALQVLLAGFESAAERDGWLHLSDALQRDDDHLYGGLLTALLRIVFLLYAEDRGLLPVEHPLYAENFSVLGLFDRLQSDKGHYPDSMDRRFGAWHRLVSLFRAVFLGVEHGDFRMPSRRGQLFDPHQFPFLEGWGPGGSAPINDPEARAATRVPSIDDGTVYGVLERLLVLEGQRLSYRALDVEEIGSVYEALMGYHVQRLPGPAVCMKPAGVWLTSAEVLEQPSGARARWLSNHVGLSSSQARTLASEIRAAGNDNDVLAALETLKKPRTDRMLAGRLVLQPGAERRRSGSHYTPRSLTEPIVRRTLQPLIEAMGGEPSSEAILELKVCDPAMGSGAFLVEACRFLADQVVAAWTREGRLDMVAAEGEEAVLIARRLVAQRCLYGVDLNPFAVNLAKLSMWLVTLARDLPFTFLDHALRHGDSLVGLTLDQILAFHWKPQGQIEFVRKEIEAALAEALPCRERILQRAGDVTPEGQRAKEHDLQDAEDALDRVRLIGDLVVGAFFDEPSDRARQRERDQRRTLVENWLRAGNGAPPEARGLQEEIRARHPTFHWPLEFPEVFGLNRRDPLSGTGNGGVAWFDAFLGNPPFMGGSSISGNLGGAYRDWLLAVHDGAHGNADYSAHFFRRTAVLLGTHGTVGLIATNTIAQGDTRTTGLQRLIHEGFVVRDAVRSMAWPGAASVSVSVVHLARGVPAKSATPKSLDDVVVRYINSQLRSGAELPDPHRLRSNEALSFLGSKIYGQGFLLTPEERDALVARDRRNEKCIFPYLGGEEVNSTPTQTYHRYVIDFGSMTLEEAERWPDLIQIVRERVKPERDRLARTGIAGKRRRYWWQFGSASPTLRLRLSELACCMVTSCHSKHLMFSFQPPGRVFSHGLMVFLLASCSPFGVMQSRTHEAWVRLRSSSLEDRLRYSATDCFLNFPFPKCDPRAEFPAITEVGTRLYDARANYMVETNQGLTATYNLLKDPACNELAIHDLRKLHLELDRAVIEAYGWPVSDDPERGIVVPPYTAPTTPEEEKVVAVFEEAVLGRLFALNAARAKEEAKAQARAASPTSASKTKPKDRKGRAERDEPLFPGTPGE